MSDQSAYLFMLCFCSFELGLLVSFLLALRLFWLRMDALLEGVPQKERAALLRDMLAALRETYDR